MSNAAFNYGGVGQHQFDRLGTSDTTNWNRGTDCYSRLLSIVETLGEIGQTYQREFTIAGGSSKSRAGISQWFSPTSYRDSEDFDNSASAIRESVESSEQCYQDERNGYNNASPSRRFESAGASMKPDEKALDARAIKTQGELLSLLDQIEHLLGEVRDRVAIVQTDNKEQNA